MDANTENEPLRTSDMVEATRRERVPDGREEPAELRQREREEGQRPGGAETPLFQEDDARTLREKWNNIQTGFVDEPRRSVEEADQLVAQTIRRLAEMFADERKKLEHQWASGDDVSTEDLRITLQRYRSFFDRLLSM